MRLRKTKVYKVSTKKDPIIYYYVDAPNKRVAKWCGANLLDYEYVSFTAPRDLKVERAEFTGGDD